VVSLTSSSGGYINGRNSANLEILIDKTLRSIPKTPWDHRLAPHSYSEEQVISMLEFLIDNIFVSFGGTLFQYVVGIPMGTNCAPLLADLFLYSYESEFLQKLVKDKKIHEARAFRSWFQVIQKIFRVFSKSTCDLCHYASKQFHNISVVPLLLQTESSYKPTSFDKDEILANHRSFMTSLNIPSGKESEDLPYLYWIPKLHKTPYKERGKTLNSFLVFKYRLRSTINTIFEFVKGKLLYPFVIVNWVSCGELRESRKLQQTLGTMLVRLKAFIDPGQRIKPFT
jgi:hypothetical protein